MKTRTYHTLTGTTAVPTMYELTVSGRFDGGKIWDARLTQTVISDYDTMVQRQNWLREQGIQSEIVKLVAVAR